MITSTNTNRNLTATCFALTLLVATALSFAQGGAQAVASPGPALPALPVTPSINTVPTIISLQPITIKEPYATDFRSEHPQVSSGWLMVIRGDAAVLAPRALAEPLLLASGSDWIESVEWFNHGFATGYRVCFIPSTGEQHGGAPRTMEGLRVWFGSPQLPEIVDAKTLQSERALADRVGIVAASGVKIENSAAKTLANRDELVSAAKALIARWAPDESQAEAASVPVAPASK